jgi:hypothetical protein
VAIPVAQAADVAQALVEALETVDGLRATWYVSDAARPPVAVVAQPEIDYTDSTAGFCAAAWTFPVTVVVTRNNDRDAQRDLSRFVNEVALALRDATPDGVLSIDPLDARPTTVTVSGQELPAYELRVVVRA